MGKSHIHPTAIVGQGAKIGSDCYIGPYSIIGDNVSLGDDVRVESHGVIDGRTTIGSETKIFPFVSIGLPPQDLKFGGEDTSVLIGERNVIREFVTIHKGTSGGGGVTTIGSGNLLMAQVHVAHDCVVGDEVIMGNAATLAGHVEIGYRANVGAYSGVHQFCEIGREAFVGGYSLVVKSAMPFSLVQGNHARCFGMNRVGMKRRGYPKETIKQLNHAFHLLLAAKLNTTQALTRIEDEIAGVEEVDLLVEFIKNAERGVVK